MSKVSWVKLICDGQQVEIPVLRIIRTVGTQEDSEAGERKYPVKHKVVKVGKSAFCR